jgi:hypothetical protein
MPAPTLKGIRNAVGRFAAKFKHTKKQPFKQLNTPGLPKNSAIVMQNHVNSMEDYINELATAKKYYELKILDLSNRNKQLLETLQNYNKLNYTEQIKNLTLQVNGCESDLAHANSDSDRQQEEINELKAQIHNYERIIEDSNKTNRDLQDKLVKCEGSQARKLSRGSSHSSRRSSRKSGNVNPTSMARGPHNNTLTEILNTKEKLTGKEMYRLYRNIQDSMGQFGIGHTVPQMNKDYFRVVDELYQNAKKDNPTSHTKAKNAVIKILDRWQSFSPYHRGSSNNNRPPKYVEMQKLKHTQKHIASTIEPYNNN